MDIDLANLTLGQIAGLIGSLAALVFLTGIGKALASQTVLWTYTAAWLTDWLGKGVVLVVLAMAGKGVPAVGLEANTLLSTAIFIPAAGAYVVAAFASIAKNVGVDLGRLPFARNASGVFGREATSSDVAPAVTSSAQAAPPVDRNR